MTRITGAFRYLTVLPVPGSPPGEAAPLLPVLSAAIGWCGAKLLAETTSWLGPQAAAALTLLLWIALEGARRERALSRAFWKWTTALAIAVRWQAFAQLHQAPPGVLAACAAVACACQVGQAYVARPANNAYSGSLPLHLSTTGAIASAILGLAATTLAGFPHMIVILCAALFLAQALVRWFDSRDGGMNENSLRASNLIIETVCLAVAARI